MTSSRPIVVLVTALAIGAVMGAALRPTSTARVVRADPPAYEVSVDPAGADTIDLDVGTVAPDGSFTTYRQQNAERIAAWQVSPPAIPSVAAGLPIAVTFNAPIPAVELDALLAQYHLQLTGWTVVGNDGDDNDVAMSGEARTALPPIGVAMTEPVTGTSLTYSGVMFIFANLIGPAPFADLYALAQDSRVHVADSTGIQAMVDIAGDPRWQGYRIREVTVPQQYFDRPW